MTTETERLKAVADGLETTAEERREWRETAELLAAGGEDDRAWAADPLRLLRDIDRLLSERHRAEEAMRERAAEVLADLGLRADTTQAARALDTARFALLALPLTPEPTHER